MKVINSFESLRNQFQVEREKCIEQSFAKTFYLLVDPDTTYSKFMTADFTNRSLKQENKFTVKEPIEQEFASDRHPPEYYVDYKIEVLLGLSRELWIGCPMDDCSHYLSSWVFVYDGQNRFKNDHLVHEAKPLRYWPSINGISFEFFCERFNIYVDKNPQSHNLLAFKELSRFISKHKLDYVSDKDFTLSAEYPTIKQNLEAPVMFKVTIDMERNLTKTMKELNASLFPHSDSILFLMDACNTSFYEICIDSQKSRLWKSTSTHTSYFINATKSREADKHLIIGKQISNKTEHTDQCQDWWLKFKCISTCLDIYGRKVFSWDIRPFTDISVLCESDLKYRNANDFVKTSRFIREYSQLGKSDKKTLNEINTFYQKFCDISVEWGTKGTKANPTEYDRYLNGLSKIRKRLRDANSLLGKDEKLSRLPVQLNLQSLTPAVIFFEYCVKQWMDYYKAKIKTVDEFLHGVFSTFHNQLIDDLNTYFVQLSGGGNIPGLGEVSKDRHGQADFIRFVCKRAFSEFKQKYTKTTYSKAYPVENIIDDAGLLIGNDGYLFTNPFNNMTDIKIGDNATSDHIISDKDGGDGKLENCAIMDQSFNSMKNAHGHVGSNPLEYYELVLQLIEGAHESDRIDLDRYLHSSLNLSKLIKLHREL